MTKKKNSLGKRIFMFILLIILIAGGFIGYRYYLSEQKSNFDEPVFEEVNDENEQN